MFIKSHSFTLSYVLTFLLPAFIYASPKNPEIDSMQMALQKESDNKTRLEIFKSIYEYWEHKNTDSAIYYADRALNKALSVQDSLEIAEINCNLGILYLEAGNAIKAISHLQKSLSVAKRNNFHEISANSYNNIGNVLQNEENYERALQQYFKSADINKKIDNQIGIANNMNNIAVTYRLMGDLDKSIDYLRQSYDIYNNMDNLTGKAHTYNNMGIVYYQMNKPGLALKSFYKVAKIRKELGQYLEYGNTLFNISYILNHLKEYEKAKEICLQSLHQAKSVSSMPLKRASYFKLVDICSSLGEYEKAYNYHKKLVVVADSLYNIDKQNQLLELKSKYFVEKERYEINLLEKENELIKNRILRLNYYLFSSGTLFVLLLVLSGLIYFNNRTRTKHNKKLEERNKIISDQKDEYYAQREAIKKYYEELNRQQKEIIEQKNLVENKTLALEKAVLSLEHKNEKIKSSMRYAGKLQKTMETNVNELNKCFKNVLVYRKQMDEVFNSFYWINVTEKHCLVTFADTKGYGIPGAFIMILINDLLNKLIKNNNEISTRDLINNIEKGICSPENNNNRFLSDVFEKISLTILKIDLKSYKASFMSKNLSLIYISNSKNSVINKIKNSNNNMYHESNISLKPGDIIFMPNKNAFDYLTNKDGFLKPVFSEPGDLNKSRDTTKKFNSVKYFLDKSVAEKPCKGDLMLIGFRI